MLFKQILLLFLQDLDTFSINSMKCLRCVWSGKVWCQRKRRFSKERWYQQELIHRLLASTSMSWGIVRLSICHHIINVWLTHPFFLIFIIRNCWEWFCSYGLWVFWKVAYLRPIDDYNLPFSLHVLSFRSILRFIKERKWLILWTGGIFKAAIIRIWSILIQLWHLDNKFWLLF